MTEIRELAPADASAFQTLRLQGLIECASAFASSWEEEQQTPLELVAERLRTAPGRCVLGALIGPRLVGIVGVQREEARKLAHKAFLWGMYVEHSARRRGVGRALVGAALRRASEISGVRQVNLGVNATNVAAISLYQQFGFTSFGLERGFMQLEGALHDELHMVCVLPAASQSRAGPADDGPPGCER